jgi:hypothetical protein
MIYARHIVAAFALMATACGGATTDSGSGSGTDTDGGRGLGGAGGWPSGPPHAPGAAPQAPEGCVDAFGGGKPAACCPDPPPDCKGKADGYPGYFCVSKQNQFCSCQCQNETWSCAC